MIEDLRAGFAYWLVSIASAIYPPLLSEIVQMTCNEIVKNGDPNA